MNNNSLYKWGSFPPSRFAKLVLTLPKLGFGRGKLKNIIFTLFKLFHLSESIDYYYHGIKLRLRPLENTLDAKILCSSVFREKTEIDFIEDNAQLGGTFIDLGANFGYYSLFAAKFGYENILSIEANPSLCKRVIFHAEINMFTSRIDVLNLAVGEEEKTSHLALLKGDQGSNFIIDDLDQFNGKSIEVNMNNLFSIVQEKNISEINLLKIDIEGMEDQALVPFFTSAPKALWPKLIIIEDINSTEWSTDLLLLLKDLNYVIDKRSRSNLMLRNK